MQNNRNKMRNDKNPLLQNTIIPVGADFYHSAILSVDLKLSFNAARQVRR